MPADVHRTGGGMLLTRRTSYGGRGSASAARRIEAARWLADHADELAAPDDDIPAPPAWNGDEYDTDPADDGIMADALADLHEHLVVRRTTTFDGWGDTFDPADCQWGFTTHRSPHTLPGAISGRPQPAHLVR